MSAAVEYLCGSVFWSVVWFLTGVVSTLATQAILNHWRHQ